MRVLGGFLAALVLIRVGSRRGPAVWHFGVTLLDSVGCVGAVAPVML